MNWALADYKSTVSQIHQIFIKRLTSLLLITRDLNINKFSHLTRQVMDTDQ